MRDLCRDGNYKTASARLRQLADALDRLSKAQNGPVFPKSVAGWTIKDTNRRIHIAIDRDALLEVRGDADKDTTESDL